MQNNNKTAPQLTKRDIAFLQRAATTGIRGAWAYVTGLPGDSLVKGFDTPGKVNHPVGSKLYRPGMLRTSRHVGDDGFRTWRPSAAGKRILANSPTVTMSGTRRASKGKKTTRKSTKKTGC